MEDADLLRAIGIGALLFAGSVLASAPVLKREVARSASRKEPMPRIHAWWCAVARRGWWLAGAGAVLVGGGMALRVMGRGGPGSWLILLGLAAVAYAAQGWWLWRVGEKAARAAAKIP